MESILGYIAGVALHVGFKWSTWKRPGLKWRDYWKQYAGLNIAGAIAALVCFGFWESGAIPGLLAQMLKGAYLALNVTAEPQVPTGFWGSMAAGYLMDSIAKNLWVKFGAKVDKDNVATGNGG